MENRNIMHVKNNLIVIKALMEPHTYYVFRNDGTEIKVVIRSGIIYSDKVVLNEEEKNYFETEFKASYKPLWKLVENAAQVII